MSVSQGPRVEMTHSLVPGLERVARTAQQVSTYIGNGLTAWKPAGPGTRAGDPPPAESLDAVPAKAGAAPVTVRDHGADMA